VTLGFVLATCNEADLALCGRLAAAALDGGHEVRLFLMHDGARFAERAQLRGLIDRGAEAWVCGTSAREHAVASPHAHEGSQLDHAALLRECDRVLGFS
jgi:sulfur relay (sulfurtransferase) complex TusBCD TusD component (DsrE family)